MGAYYDYYLDGIHCSDFIMESSPEDWYLYSNDGAYETTESRVTARINHYDGPGDH